jgi:alpha-1,3-glucosyltransferase
MREVVKVGITVVLTFALCWFPFISSAGDVLTRMFPFNRGLFEDKVANFWCSVSVLVKVRDIFSRVALVRAALFFTLVSVLPSQILLFRESSPQKFILALTNSALGFFLFSFHVHEKTILIPLTTVVLLYNDKRANAQTDEQSSTLTVSLPAVWFTVIATFSMWPLLLKDGLCVMYVAGMGLYLTTVHILFKNQLSNRRVLLFYLSVLGCISLHILEIFVTPPERYPHIYPTLNSLYCAGHFALFFCYFNYRQIID